MRSLLFLLFLFLNSKLWAAGFDSLLFRPANGQTKSLSVFSSRMLEPGQVQSGLWLYYQSRSLQVLQADSVKFSILDHALMQHLGIALGLHPKWAELSVDVPFAWSLGFKDPSQPNPREANQQGIGDMRVAVKTWHLKPLQNMDFSLLPSIHLPTGDDDLFIGTKTIVWGIKALSEFQWERWSANLNVGLSTQSAYHYRNISRSHEFHYELATSYRILPEALVAMELVGRSKLTDLFARAEDNPIEAHFLTRFFLTERCQMDLFGSAGLQRGMGVPLMRVGLGLLFGS